MIASRQVFPTRPLRRLNDLLKIHLSPRSIQCQGDAQ
jgi:hypothetical protein